MAVSGLSRVPEQPAHVIQHANIVSDPLLPKLDLAGMGPVPFVPLDHVGLPDA